MKRRKMRPDHLRETLDLALEYRWPKTGLPPQHVKSVLDLSELEELCATDHTEDEICDWITGKLRTAEQMASQF